MSADSIVRIATALFAEHGYHGASTRAIAAAAGVNLSTVHYHVGGKADLYRRVFQQVTELEHAHVNELLAQARALPLETPEQVRVVLELVAARLVEMNAEHPEIARLWVRRWLDDPDGREIEQEFTVPVYRAFDDFLAHLTAATAFRFTGPSLELFLKSVTWTLYGYTLGGPLDWKTARGAPEDPANLAQLAGFLTDYFLRYIKEEA